MEMMWVYHPLLSGAGLLLVDPPLALAFAVAVGAAVGLLVRDEVITMVIGGLLAPFAGHSCCWNQVSIVCASACEHAGHVAKAACTVPETSEVKKADWQKHDVYSAWFATGAAGGTQPT